jgi:type VI secretion system protein ImpE
VDPTTLFQAGKLEEAVEALGAALRKDPTDLRSRTFLFELLCFSGDYDRAEKQLDIIADGSREAEMGAWVYRSALHAERLRQEMFETDTLPQVVADDAPISGVLDGNPFTSLTDADPRIGPRLEIFAAGQYTWLPLRHVATIRMEAPKRLRDLLWAPARLQTGPEFRGTELGEVLIPVLAPLSWKNPDPAVRLGRVTDFEEQPDGSAVPVGQKLFLVDDEPVPLLEIRALEIGPAPQS